MIHGRRPMIPCDCLIRCGDDPRIDDGRADACEPFKVHKAHCEQVERDYQERRSLLRELGFKTDLQALRHLAAMMRVEAKRR